MADFDVIVAGGSVAGLLAAREIATKGHSVLVLEEDAEIGTPEHCGGLVSMRGIEELGVIPSTCAIENDRITSARVVSPKSGFEITAENQRVIVLDRRHFDKQIALQAQKMGAEIRVRTRMISCDTAENYQTVKTSTGSHSCHYFVDATGVASIIKKDRKGILQSAQYEVYASWIEPDTIEVAFDNQRYPGFFAWIIPTIGGCAKIGVAGCGINSATTLEAYLGSKGKHSVVRKVYAPIWVGGPLPSFVQRRTITIGDAAGQSKPTTAGGIFTCGMGGILSGRAISKALESSDDNALIDYQRLWDSAFGSEFDRMLLARRLFERLDNKALDDILSAVPPDVIRQASESGDFDFHSTAVSKILSTKSALKLAKAVLGNELRRLVDLK
jgi:digeranylgeranylglycerophospholipid reductase